MRVIHWYPSFLNGGAMSSSVLGLADAQAHLSHDVVIVSQVGLDPLVEQVLRENFRGKTLAWKPLLKFNIKNMPVAVPPLSLIRSIRRFSPDVFHMHGGTIPDHVFIRFFVKATTVLTPQGDFHPARLRRSKNIVRYIRLAKRLFYSRLSAFHAFSSEEADYILRVFPFATVYSVAQGGSPLVGHHSLCRDVTFDKERDKAVRILFVGRLTIDVKGIDIILLAFAHLMRKTDRNLKLLMVGPQWKDEFQTIKNMVRECGIEKHVDFPGKLGGAEIARLLRDSDIYLQPSRSEGQSLSVIDALKAGLPSVLSTMVGLYSYPEIARLPYVRFVKPNVTEVADALSDMVDNLERYKKSANECRAFVQSFFDWKNRAEDHIVEYGRISRTRCRSATG